MEYTDKDAHLKYKLDSFSGNVNTSTHVSFGVANKYLNIEGVVSRLQLKKHACALNAPMNCYVLQPTTRNLLITAVKMYPEGLKERIVAETLEILKEKREFEYLYFSYKKDDKDNTTEYANKVIAPIIWVMIQTLAQSDRSLKIKSDTQSFTSDVVVFTRFLYGRYGKEDEKVDIGPDGYCNLMTMTPHVLFAMYVLGSCCYGNQNAEEMFSITTLHSLEEEKMFSNLFLEGMAFDAQEFINSTFLRTNLFPNLFSGPSSCILINNSQNQEEYTQGYYESGHTDIYNSPLSLFVYCSGRYEGGTEIHNYYSVDMPLNQKTNLKARYHLTGIILKSDVNEENDGHYTYLHIIYHSQVKIQYVEYDNLKQEPIEHKQGISSMHYRFKALIYTREDCIKFEDMSQMITSAPSEQDQMMDDIADGLSTTNIDSIDTEDNNLIFANFCALCASDKELSSAELFTFEFKFLLEYIMKADKANLEKVKYHNVGIYFIGRYFDEDPQKIFRENTYLLRKFVQSSKYVKSKSGENSQPYSMYMYTNDDRYCFLDNPYASNHIWTENTPYIDDIIPPSERNDIKRNYPATWMMILLLSRRKILGMHIEITVSYYLEKNPKFIWIMKRELKRMSKVEFKALETVFWMCRNRYDKLFDLSEGEDSIECLKNNKICKNVVILSLISNIFICCMFHVIGPEQFNEQEMKKKCNEYLRLLKFVLQPYRKHIPREDMSSVLALK